MGCGWEEEKGGRGEGGGRKKNEEDGCEGGRRKKGEKEGGEEGVINWKMVKVSRYSFKFSSL